MSKLRDAIRSAAPHADEIISYGMPTYKQAGTYVVYLRLAEAYRRLPAARHANRHRSRTRPLPQRERHRDLPARNGHSLSSASARHHGAAGSTGCRAIRPRA
ncbi:hypothetical protein [Devosia sp.]|uniref:hypothetical protein n=1 Tax=Devosia sp. TaxID=1871048 RepID=UPI003A8C8C36